MLGEGDVDERWPLREALAGDDTQHAVLPVEPDGGDVLLPGARADHECRPARHARGVAHVLAHAPGAPLGQQVGRAPSERHQQVRPVTPALGRGHRVGLAVGLADPDPVAHPEPDLAAALHLLLDALALGELEQDPLLARRLGEAAGGVVERQGLLDQEVGDADVLEPGHERLDGGPDVGAPVRRRAGGEAGERDEGDDQAPHDAVILTLHAALRYHKRKPT